MSFQHDSQPYIGPYSSTQDVLTSNQYTTSEQIQIDLPELNTKKNTRVPGTSATNETRICGLRRMIFIVLLISILLVLVVLAGTVGGVLGKKKSTPMGEAPNSPVPPPQNSTEDVIVPPPKPMRQIATAEKRSSYFNCWQKGNGEIWIHAFYGDVNRFTEPWQVPTDIPAIKNTPLAVLAGPPGSIDSPDDPYFLLLVSYMAEGQNETTLVTFICPTDGRACFREYITDGIIPNPRIKLNPGQASFLLAADANMFRHYTVDSDGLVAESSYDYRLPREWKASSPIGSSAKAHKSSPVTAGKVGDEIWVLWFDDQKRLKMAVCPWSGSHWSYRDIPAAIPSELPRALGITVSDTPNVVQVFYFEGARMQQAQFTSGKWTSSTVENKFPEASIENGPVGVVGWNNTSVRMFFPVVGSRRIREVVYENIHREWRIGGMGEDDYD